MKAYWLIRCLLAAGLLLVSACTKHGDHRPNTDSAAATTSDLPADKDPFDKPSCGSSQIVAVRAEGTPVDDVRGLRLGTPVDVAITFIECLNHDARYASAVTTNSIDMTNLNYFGRQVRTQIDIATGTPRPPIPAPSVQVNPANVALFRHSQPSFRPGMLGGNGVNDSPTERFSDVKERFMLLAMGEPGSEKVFGIWQAQYFKDDENPTVSSLIGNLKEKYGEPGETTRDPPTLVWKWNSEGHRLKKFDVLFDQCTISTNIGNPGSSQSECGLTIGAQISTRRDNPMLATDLVVGVTDQARLLNTGQELAARWKAADEQKKRAEVERAGNVQAPKL